MIQDTFRSARRFNQAILAGHWWTSEATWPESWLPN